MYYDGAYAPFGQAYAQSGTTDLNFTGMDQHIVSGLYDFPAREYNGLEGRWPSPDPAGLAAVNPADPQTWNRYSYVRNSPLALSDPTGMSPNGPGCAAHVRPEDSIGGCGPSRHSPWLGGGSLDGVDFGDISSSLIGGSEANNVYVGSGVGGGWLADPAGGAYNPTTGCYTDRGGIKCDAVGFAETYGSLDSSGFPSNLVIPSPAGLDLGGATGGPQTPSRAVCAANLADKYSIAGAVGTIGKTGFLDNVFNGVAGNTFSGLTLVFSGQGNKYRFGTSIVNAPSPVGFGVTTGAVSSTAEFFGGELVGKVAGGVVTFGKLGYDAASFGVAYYECGKQQ